MTVKKKLGGMLAGLFGGVTIGLSGGKYAELYPKVAGYENLRDYSIRSVEYISIAAENTLAGGGGTYLTTYNSMFGSYRMELYVDRLRDGKRLVDLIENGKALIHEEFTTASEAAYSLLQTQNSHFFPRLTEANRKIGQLMGWQGFCLTGVAFGILAVWLGYKWYKSSTAVEEKPFEKLEKMDLVEKQKK